jgi:hypothetical protein
VRARRVHVLAPEQDRPRVLEVEEVVRVLLAEVRGLRGVTCARADVAALDRHGSEGLEQPVQHEPDDAEVPAAAVVEDRGRARLGLDADEPAGGEVEGLVPSDGAELAALLPADERRRQAVGRVLPLEEERRPVAQEAPCDGVVGVAREGGDAPVLDGGHDAARVGAVPVADRGPTLLHSALDNPRAA